MNEIEKDINLLKQEYSGVKKELEKKTYELSLHIEKIQSLEEEIIQLYDIISIEYPEEKMKAAIDIKISNELRDKDNKIRDLKNRIGYLRKEKLSIERELETLKNKDKPSKVINIEEIRDKMKNSSLESHNQGELDSQRLINNLTTKIESLSLELDEKRGENTVLNSKIIQLKKELANKNAIIEGNATKEILKGINQNFKNKMNKYRSKAKELKQELAKYKKTEKDEIFDNIELLELKNKVILMEEEIKDKNKLIEELVKKKSFSI